jgi:hypothetical protein
VTWWLQRLKAQLEPLLHSELRTHLKTIRDGCRAGLSSGLIRRGSRASAEAGPDHSSRSQTTLTYHERTPADLESMLAATLLRDTTLDSPQLAEQVLTVVNPDTRLVIFKGIEEPYCERLGHAFGDLTTVQPVHLGSLRGWLRGTRQGTAAED